MKILFLPKWYPNKNDVQHGIFIKNQAMAIAKEEEVGVLFVITSDTHKNEDFEIKREGKYFELVYYFPKKPNRVVALYHYYRAFKKAREIFIKEWGNPDVVCLYVLGRNYMMYKKFFPGIPFVVSEQWSGYLNGGMERYIYAKRKNTINALKNADEIIAVSKPLAESIWKYSGGRNVSVIPNIVYSIGSTENKTGEAIKILTVADLDDEIKNVSGMMKALHVLSAKYKFEFKVIGEGNDEDKLRALAKSLSNDQLKINFIKRMPHEELLKEYAWSNFYILNSGFETFCVSAAEAIRAGRPVVATPCGGPEIYLNAENSVMADNMSSQALETAIEKMIGHLKNNSFDAAHLANSMKDRFGADSIAKQYITHFNRAINKKN